MPAPETSRENGKKGGRPRGSANVMTRKRADQLVRDGNTPLDVMLRNMKFWDEQAQQVGEQLKAIVIQEGSASEPEQRREAIGLLRTFLSAQENSERCAVDAAPYMHAKLQSLSVSKTSTHTTIKMNLIKAIDDPERAAYRGDGAVVPFKLAAGE